MTTIHSRKLFLMLAASLGLTAAYATETEQFVYDTLDNGEAKVTGLTNAGKAAEMLSIPETINDIPVTRIAYNAIRDAATNAPLMTISFDENGKPVVTTPSLVRTEGVTLKILSTTDLADWSNPEERTLTVGGNGKQTFDHESDPQRFYRLRAE